MFSRREFGGSPASRFLGVALSCCAPCWCVAGRSDPPPAPIAAHTCATIHLPCWVQTNCRNPVFCRLFPELVELHRQRQVQAASGASAAAGDSGSGSGSGTTSDGTGAAAGVVAAGAGGAVPAQGTATPAAAQGYSTMQILFTLAFVLVIVAAVIRRIRDGSMNADTF